jgi:hypothetical protein
LVCSVFQVCFQADNTDRPLGSTIGIIVGSGSLSAFIKQMMNYHDTMLNILIGEAILFVLLPTGGNL